MRICYFADGRYVHARHWMKYFADKGHEMHLISFAPMSDIDRAEMEAIGVKCHGSIGNFHLKRFWLTLRDLRFVKSILKRERIDVLHSHYLGANAWFGAVSGFHPHIITIMGGGDVTGPDWKPDSNIQSRFLTPYSLRKADHITSWSKLMAEVVRPYSPAETPLDVVHGGIHFERFSPGEKPEYLLERFKLSRNDKVIFSPRLIRPLSNIDKIAEAFGIARQVVPNVKLIIASPETARDEAHEKSVRQIIDSYDGGGSVRFLGELDHSEIADHFRLADVTVSVTDIDGTPMTVLESMACGTPTVIGNLADYDREYFENEKTTLMADVKDPRSIADAILRYFADDALAGRIAAEARRRVEETGSYESQMSKMEEIYQRVVAE